MQQEHSGKKNMDQMKEQIKTPEKNTTKRQRDSQPIICRVKTLVVTMLAELVQYRGKIEEKVKAMKSEIEENIQGTNSEGTEIGTQINDLEQKEETNIQPEQNEETRIQKNKERLRNLLDNFKCSNIWIIGVPEGEEEVQE